VPAAMDTDCMERDIVCKDGDMSMIGLSRKTKNEKRKGSRSNFEEKKSYQEPEA